MHRPFSDVVLVLHLVVHFGVDLQVKVFSSRGNMNIWILFLVSTVFFKNFAYSTDDIPVTICSLDDIKHRMRSHCGEMIFPPTDPTVRRRRHHKKIYLPVSESETKYIIRVKKDKVHVICCTPKLMAKQGPNCMNLYTC